MIGPQISPNTQSLMIGLMALIHFTMVSVGGLVPLVVLLMEGYALRTRNEYLLRMAKNLLKIGLEVGVVGAVLGSGVVVLLIGLKPLVITLLFNQFFWLIVLQLFGFTGGLAFQFAYYLNWDNPNGNHRLWGTIGAVLPFLPYMVFTSMTGFINNPGSWPQEGGTINAFLNPVFFPSLLHRMGAGVALIGVLIIILNLIPAWRKNDDQAEYHRYAIKWSTKLITAALLIQIPIGIIRIFAVRPEGQAMLMGGELTPIWLAGILAGLVPLVFIYFLNQIGLKLSPGSTVVLIIVPVFLAVWLMGITRSLERKTFSIAGVIDKQGQVVSFPAQIQEAGGSSGKPLFDRNCGGCHPGLAGNAAEKAKTRHPDPADLQKFLRDPRGQANVAMPPFGGTDEELYLIISYLLDIPLDQIE